MVYCKLKEKKNDSAIYYIGTDVANMTGEVAFYTGMREPEILKQPEGDIIHTAHIARIFGKYSNEFKKGIFKEKLAYEIG